MTAHAEKPEEDTSVAGTPSERARKDAHADAADPAATPEQNRGRVGSAGGGPYPTGSDRPDNQEPR